VGIGCRLSLMGTQKLGGEGGNPCSEVVLVEGGTAVSKRFDMEQAVHADDSCPGAFAVLVGKNSNYSKGGGKVGCPHAPFRGSTAAKRRHSTERK